MNQAVRANSEVVGFCFYLHKHFLNITMFEIVKTFSRPIVKP